MSAWKRRAIALYCSAALVTAPLLSQAAIAADYAGGNGGNGGSATNFGGSGSGAGGTGGTNGSGGSAPGGGGGGGYSPGYPGGPGGGADGGGGGGTYYGTAGTGGGGGAGGAGYILADGDSFTSSGNVTGGKGGDGGSGLFQFAPNTAGGGGGGGGGGSGIIVLGAGTITSSTAIKGGEGGLAGGTGAANPYLGGYGGAGGHGIRADNATGITINNSGDITGGDYGTATAIAAQSRGGSAIYGQNITLYNTGGTLKGGLGTISSLDGAGIELTGGTNQIHLSGGGIVSQIYGDAIRASNGTNVYTISNSAAVTLDQNGVGLNVLGGSNNLTMSGGGMELEQSAIGIQVSGGVNNVFTLNGGNIATKSLGNGNYSGYNSIIGVSGGSSTFNISAGNLVSGYQSGGAVKLTGGTNIFNISGTANFHGNYVSDVFAISSGVNTLNISGGDVTPSQYGIYSVNISGGTNTLNVTGGTVGKMRVGGGTTVIKGGGFSDTFTVESGATAQLAGSTTADDVSGITALDNYGAVDIGDSRSLTVGSFTNRSGATLSLGAGSQLISSSLNLVAGSIITGAGSLSSGSNAFNLTSGTIATALSGTGGLVKTGPGVLTLTGVNSYTGGTTISEGSLSVTDGALGGGDVHMAEFTGIAFAGSSFTTGNNFFLSGDPIFDVASGTTQTLTGVIADDTGPGATPGILEKLGDGELVLAAANTYSGGTILSAGRLTVGVNSVRDGNDVLVSSAIGTGSLTLDGGTLGVDASRAIYNSIALTANGGTLDAGSRAFEVYGDITGNAGTLNISGAFGTVILGGTNTYSAATVVDANATLMSLGPNGLSDASDYTVNGKLLVRPLQPGWSNPTPVAAIKSLSGTGTVNPLIGDMVLAIAPHLNQTATFDGTIGDGGGGNPRLGIEINGAGTQVFTAANSYSGGTLLTGGTLAATNAGALGSGAVTFDGGALKIGGAFDIGNTIVLAGNGGTVDNDGNAVTLSGNITDGAAGGVLTLKGGGSATLTGSNSFTGGTDVESGTLIATAASQVGTGAISLGYNAILSLQDNGDTYANDIRLLSNTTIRAGTGLDIALDGVISDASVTPGSVTFTGNAAGNSYLAINGDNSYTGGTFLQNVLVAAGNDHAFGTGQIMANAAIISSRNASLTLDNDIKVASVNGASFRLDGNTITLNGLISDSTTNGKVDIGLTRDATAPGTLVLNGANTYTGGSVISGGNTVVLATDTALGSGKVELFGATLQAAAGTSLNLGNALWIDSGDAFVLGNGTELTLGGVISDGANGVGHLTLGAGGAADSSIVTLSGSNSFTGGLTIAGGTVVAGTSTALGTSGVTLAADTRLVYADAASVANRLDISGNVTFAVANGESATQSGDIGDDGPATPYTITKAGAGTLVWSGTNTSAANVRLGAGVLAIADQNALGGGTYIFDGGTLRLDGDYLVHNDLAVDGGGGVLDIGNHAVELSGTLYELGGAGYLSVSGTGSVLISGTNNLTGGTAVAAGGRLTVANAFALGSGDVALGDGSVIAFINGSSSFSNNHYLDGTVTFDVESGRTTILTGVIADAPPVAAPGVLEKTGQGTLVLTGANSYSGGSVLREGAVLVDHASALGTGVVTLDGGSLGWQVSYPGTLSDIGNDIVLTAQGGTIIVPNSSASVSGWIQTAVLGGTISGNGLLTIEGAGSDYLALTGANTYVGGTYLDGARISLGNAAAFGTGAVTLSGALLSVTDTVSIANDMILTGGISTIATGGNADLTLSGVISEQTPGGGLIAITGSVPSLDRPEIVRLTGANSYGGETHILSATVEAGNSFALGTSQVTLAQYAVLGLVPGVALANDVYLGDATSAIRVISGSAALSGAIQDDGMTTGGGFTKLGAGTLRLTGSNGYTGATTVAEGVLELGASDAAVVADYSVASGARLQADGALGSITIASLAGAGDVTIGSGTDLYVGMGSSSDTTFSGVLTASALVYEGSGTLTLSGTGNSLDALSVCSCTTLGGIVIHGGTTDATTEVAVEAGTLTVNGGAVLTTGAFHGVGGTTEISGAGTSLTADTLLLLAGPTAGPAFTVSGGASVSVDSVGVNAFLGNPGILVTGTGSRLAAANEVSLGLFGDGATLTLADGGALDTPLIALNAGSQLRFGAGGAAGTLADANAFITTSDSSYQGSGVVADFTGSMTLDAWINGNLSVSVEKGDLTLTNTLNDYDGGTRIAAGASLTVRNNAVGSGAIVNDGILVLDTSFPLIMSNGISGTGSLAQAGDGALTFDAAQTYTGRTLIAPNATLYLTGAGDLSRSSTIEAYGAFDVSGVTATNVTIGALFGDGDVAVGGKTLVVSGNGGIFSGMLSDGGAGGSLVLLGNQVLNGIVSLRGSTTFGPGTTVTVSGPGALGGNALRFLAGTTLKFGGSGTYGNAMDFAVGAPVFDVTGQRVTLSGLIGGPGDLAVTGGGTLILTNAANSYAGGTAIYGGATLRAPSDGALGASTGALQLGDASSRGTFQFGGAFGLAAERTITVAAGGGVLDTNGFDVTLGQAIGGTGLLTKTGTGRLNLTGASTLSGGAAVTGGTLAVNGSLASAVTVASGGTLGGTGTVAGARVDAGGTLAPGNSIGTLRIAGDLTLAPGATTALEISPAAADQVVVTGAAALNGTLAFSPAPGPYAAGTGYTLITAASVNGVFSGVTGLAATGLDANVTYSATAVRLALTAADSGGGGSSGSNGSGGGNVTTSFLFGTYGVTPNQIAAGNALATGSNAGALYTAMGGMVASNRGAVPQALGQLAGDFHASLRAAAMEDSRAIRNILLDRMHQAGDGPVVWATGFGGFGGLRGDGNAESLRHDNAGFLAGVDSPVLPGLRLGFAAGYSSTHARTTGRLSTAHGEQGHVGGYALLSLEDIRVTLGGDYGFGQAQMTRAIGGLGHVNTARLDQDTGQVFADLGYRLALDGLVVQPHVTLAHVAATSGGFTETGSVSALSGGAQRDSVTYGLLGLRTEMAAMALDGYDVIPRLDLGWQHMLSPLVPGQTVRFQDSGTSFLVLGTPLARDAAAVQLGLDVRRGPLALSLSYDGALAGSADSHGVRGGVRWSF